MEYPYSDSGHNHDTHSHSTGVENPYEHLAPLSASARTIQFAQDPDPFASTPSLHSTPSFRTDPFASSTSLASTITTNTREHDLGSRDDATEEDESIMEKQPLTKKYSVSLSDTQWSSTTPGEDGSSGYYPPTEQETVSLPRTPRARAEARREGIESGWRRRQTIKRGVTKKVKLTKGHFINEYPVPTAVYSGIEGRWKDDVKSKEFSHMRYTAATCDPDEFTVENGWSLRTKLYNRPTELLIAVTSYNEDKGLYSRTLHGVMENVRDICRTKATKYWKRSAEEGIPGWQRITVALVVDGLDPMDKTVLDLLATVGIYQDGVMKKKVDGKDTVAHIFEYTTQLSVDSTPQLVLPRHEDPETLVPVQFVLILKAQNQKKINSHRWLFNALGGMLQPEICVLIDAGTKPGRKSIYHLWEAFYNDRNLGGCCGEIHAMLDGGRKLFNPLVAAQNFEYKMSNILDKPLESSFGYVSVLPGAFSAYRFRAVLGRPLQQYFHGDQSLASRLGDKGVHGMNIFTKNMFLAEDRILCFELVAKAGQCWTLAYVKPSKAETDVPESAAELIGQRRRWLNGSFAASIYAIVHFFRLYRSRHNVIRMMFFHVQAVYNILTLFFSWFALANLYLAFTTIIELVPALNVSVFNTNNAATFEYVNQILRWVWVMFLSLQFILALGNRPKGEKAAYVITFLVYAILAAYMVVASIALTIDGLVKIPSELAGTHGFVGFMNEFLKPPIGSLVMASVSTFGIYFLSSFIYRDPWHMFSSFFQYLCIAPSFTNILNVYAFCNLHDVSWGTKGSDTVDALPEVSSKKVKNKADDNRATAVVEDTYRTQQDLDAVFNETLQRTMVPLEEDYRTDKPTLDDQNKTFRTRLVVAWMLTNALVALGVENADGLVLPLTQTRLAVVAKECGDPTRDLATCLNEELLGQQAELSTRQGYYFSFILYGTFFLALVRFTGCMFYFFRRNLFRCCRRK
ncbi:glycosyltransferase family 2 protein [Peniophora sp. CONT]|nr:glycosyltransferase family 2 protein [Peniophora sp. CONT]